MKFRHTLLLCVVLLMSMEFHAQEPLKAITQERVAPPSLFSSLPEQFECDQTALQKIVSGSVNEQIIAQLSGQFLLKGIILEKVNRKGGAYSINFRVQNYHNAIFNISVRLLADNSITIQGRILHPQYDDVLVLSKERDKYFFRKKLLRLYMTE